MRIHYMYLGYIPIVFPNWYNFSWLDHFASRECSHSSRLYLPGNHIEDAT